MFAKANDLSAFLAVQFRLQQPIGAICVHHACPRGQVLRQFGAKLWRWPAGAVDEIGWQPGRRFGVQKAWVTSIQLLAVGHDRVAATSRVVFIADDPADSQINVSVRR
jgi:hypothetical protein